MVNEINVHFIFHSIEVKKIGIFSLWIVDREIVIEIVFVVVIQATQEHIFEKKIQKLNLEY